jgi:hypothetical protein
MDSNEIGSQVSKITDTTKDQVRTATDTVTDMAGKGWAAAVDAGGALQAAAADTARQIGDAAVTAYRQGLEASRFVSENTAKQPLPALLIAGAIGFSIAYLLYRR